MAQFVNMETLDLNDAYVTDDIMPGLVGMKKLRRLTMVGTLITDEGLKYLQDLTALEELDLYGVHLTDKGVQYLRKLTQLRRRSADKRGCRTDGSRPSRWRGFQSPTRNWPLSSHCGPSNV